MGKENIKRNARIDYHYWDARRVANGRKISPLRKEKENVAVLRKRARFGGRQDVNVMEKERRSGKKFTFVVNHYRFERIKMWGMP